MRELEFFAPLEVSILSERRVTAPFGLQGGEAGARGRNRLRRAGGRAWTPLGGRALFAAKVGDRLRVETPGGGGFGAPEGRARAL